MQLGSSATYLLPNRPSFANLLRFVVSTVSVHSLHYVLHNLLPNIKGTFQTTVSTFAESLHVFIPVHRRPRQLAIAKTSKGISGDKISTTSFSFNRTIKTFDAEFRILCLNGILPIVRVHQKFVIVGRALLLNFFKTIMFPFLLPSLITFFVMTATTTSIFINEFMNQNSTIDSRVAARTSHISQ